MRRGVSTIPGFASYAGGSVPVELLAALLITLIPTTIAALLAFSSALKYYGAELNKRRYELLMAAGGAGALEWEGARSDDGALPRAWLRTKANSIEGGTSEVQLNIVSKRILGLPGA